MTRKYNMLINKANANRVCIIIFWTCFTCGMNNVIEFNDGIKFPPSLRNIFKELNQDVGKPIPETGNLIEWAKQGILLLNSTLQRFAR